MQEMRVWSLGWEDPLEKEMVTHFSILAWEIPQTEEPGGLQSMGSQRVAHDWPTQHTHTHTHTHTHNEFRKKCISMKQTLSQVALKSVCPGLMSGSLSKLWKSHWLHQYSIMQNPSGFCFLDLSLSPAHYSVTFGKSVKCLRVICTIGKNRKPFPSHLTGSAGAKRWFGKDTAPPQFPSDPSHQSCLSHQGT